MALNDRRPDQPQMGFTELSAMRNLITAPDGARYAITEEIAVLKKFDAKPDGTEWTAEQMDAGEADASLAEVITTRNGVVIDRWVRGETDGSG